MAGENPAAKRQPAVTVYSKSKQLLVFAFWCGIADTVSMLAHII